MKKHIDVAFASHILRYVGVGLISGSIVHVGTLGGSPVRYFVLIAAGALAFVLGTLLEKEKEVITLSYVVISIALSFGVGMVSGGTQHYLDGPVYASFLIPLGLLLGYITFVTRENVRELQAKKVLAAIAATLLLFGALYALAHSIPTLANHHESTEDHH